MSIFAELDLIASDLRDCAAKIDAPEIAEPAERLETVTNEFGTAWSGSFFGYHTNIYYKNFKPPPPGDHF